MRFVFVLSSFQLYGGVLLVIEYANRLVQRDHSVLLFTPGGTVDPNLRQRLHSSVRIIECSAQLSSKQSSGKQSSGKQLSPKQPFGNVVRLLWSMARELPRADVVVATHTPTTAAILLAALINFLPNNSSRMDLSASTSARQRPARAWLYMDYPEMFKGRWLERLLLRFAPSCFDVLWTISTPLKDVVAAHTQSPVVVTGSGIQNGDLFFTQARIKLKDNRRRILYVGTSLPRKGLREFLMAMQIVHERYQDCIIVVVGTDDCLALIDESELGQSATADLIEFHSQPSDEALSQLYASSNLFVSASWGEGLGYPPLEAMSCGTPVVLTDSGGVRDYAQHEENCLMVAPKDIPAMAAAVARLLDDADLAQYLSANGAETVKKYNWSAVIDKVEASAYEIKNSLHLTGKHTAK